jgi:hypothetical protein
MIRPKIIMRIPTIGLKNANINPKRKIKTPRRPAALTAFLLSTGTSATLHLAQDANFGALV